MAHRSAESPLGKRKSVVNQYRVGENHVSPLTGLTCLGSHTSHRWRSGLRSDIPPGLRGHKTPRPAFRKSGDGMYMLN